MRMAMRLHMRYEKVIYIDDGMWIQVLDGIFFLSFRFIVITTSSLEIKSD